MTDQIIKLKNFSLKLLLLSHFFAFSAFGASQENRLPHLLRVGVIPVQWDNKGDIPPRLDEKVTRVERIFPSVVRESNRFRVLDDDLVKSMWSSPSGRNELVEQYELNGFASLSVIVEPDTFRFTARLMSPKLANYLSEQEFVSLNWIRNADDGDLRDKLQTLVFRLFNRLPIDMTVTSVQGRFLTLSGGGQIKIFM